MEWVGSGVTSKISHLLHRGLREPNNNKIFPERVNLSTLSHGHCFVFSENRVSRGKLLYKV